VSSLLIGILPPSPGAGCAGILPAASLRLLIPKAPLTTSPLELANSRFKRTLFLSSLVFNLVCGLIGPRLLAVLILF
jgi:hypothetical protein